MYKHLTKLSLAGVVVAATLAFDPGPAGAGRHSSCPLFTAAMVDAAALAAGIVPGIEGEVLASDDIQIPRITCEYSYTYGSGTGYFAVIVDGMYLPEEEENDHYLFLLGTNTQNSNTTNVGGALGGIGAFTDQQLLSCRAEVLQSFVWNTICAPRMMP